MRIIYAQVCLILLMSVAYGCETKPQPRDPKVVLEFHEEAKGEKSRGFNLDFIMEATFERDRYYITITITNTGDKPEGFPVPYEQGNRSDRSFYLNISSGKLDMHRGPAPVTIIEEEVILPPGCSLRVEGLTLGIFGYGDLIYQEYFRHGELMNMEMEFFYSPSPRLLGWGVVHVRKNFTLERPHFSVRTRDPREYRVGYKIIDKSGKIIEEKTMVPVELKK